jgi:hypothetical protein
MVSGLADRSANIAGWSRPSANRTPAFAIARLPDASVAGYLADGKARRVRAQLPHPDPEQSEGEGPAHPGSMTA